MHLIKNKIISDTERTKMIREYFVVARYLARTPEGKDPIEAIYSELESDLISLFKSDQKQKLRDIFNVVEGNEISEEDYENE